MITDRKNQHSWQSSTPAEYWPQFRPHFNRWVHWHKGTATVDSDDAHLGVATLSYNTTKFHLCIQSAHITVTVSLNAFFLLYSGVCHLA